MTTEQREAIKSLEKLVNLRKSKNTIKHDTCICGTLDLDTVLSLIKEQETEIEKLKGNVDYQVLCDFLINSVCDEEEPIWTEKHIEELLDNFEVRWKDAHK